MILVFDTETSGLPDWKAPLIHHSNPRLVQLGAVLYDEDNVEVMSLSVIVKPEGWEVEKGAEKVHGISTYFATQVGIPLKVALSMFSNFCCAADTVVAHNLDFDRRIIQSELMRVGALDRVEEMKKYCTMQGSKNILQLSGGRGGDYKYPKLSEAYRYFTGREIDGAHDALVDTRACAECYFALMKDMKKSLTLALEKG